MTSPRLTGLEFYWFEKGRRLARESRNGSVPDLPGAVVALTFAASDDAKGSYTGPESLRRVAERFLSDAAASIDEARLAARPSPGLDQRIAALRDLSVSFDRAAEGVEVWKKWSAELAGTGSGPGVGDGEPPPCSPFRLHRDHEALHAPRGLHPVRVRGCAGSAKAQARMPARYARSLPLPKPRSRQLPSETHPLDWTIE